MRCPFCEHTESRVLESRSTESGQSVRRRRQCLNCKRRFTTYERIEFVPMIAIKRDGKRESFDRSKLLRGIVRACEKTAIAPERLEAIVDDIELRLHQRPKREIHTSEIGELVLDSLKDLSEVAYVRFASVYQQFQGVRDFVEALDRLRESRLEENFERQRQDSPESTPNCAISS
ncbi:transcriptional regulator NrdR [Phormidium yuhuli AB48]|uniref:Transcriptional repressor NrdR n=1 Tax=Phormidium yuhuli AB48 TaxID=2940671 RepID=A0ABY5AKB1_9CYAN|nr:transcriptional regulator NrdR [Phormidium yuhuli]USR89386.1 transcriptional regulator NrdR [Phormidium yuhuli AB48]